LKLSARVWHVRRAEGSKIGIKLVHDASSAPSFEDARDFVRRIGLKDQKEWLAWRRDVRPHVPEMRIPRQPEVAYAAEWVDLRDWLGVGVATQVRTLSPSVVVFSRCRSFFCPHHSSTRGQVNPARAPVVCTALHGVGVLGLPHVGVLVLVGAVTVSRTGRDPGHPALLDS